jgi:hypothetical protein
MAAAVVPLALLSYVVCGRPLATILGATALAAVLAAASWRGQDAGRGARMGLLAGAPPLLLPIAIQTTGHVCGGSFCVLFPVVCIAGGVAGGLLLAGWARRQGFSASAVASGAVVTALTGSLGCLVAGLSGIGGLALGLAIGMAPLLSLRRA